MTHRLQTGSANEGLALPIAFYFCRHSTEVQGPVRMREFGVRVLWLLTLVPKALSPLTTALPSFVESTPPPSSTRRQFLDSRNRPIDDSSATLSAVETAAAFCGVVDDGALRPSLTPRHTTAIYIATER